MNSRNHTLRGRRDRDHRARPHRARRRFASAALLGGFCRRGERETPSRTALAVRGETAAQAGHRRGGLGASSARAWTLGPAQPAARRAGIHKPSLALGLETEPPEGRPHRVPRARSSSVVARTDDVRNRDRGLAARSGPAAGPRWRISSRRRSWPTAPCGAAPRTPWATSRAPTSRCASAIVTFSTRPSASWRASRLSTRRPDE